MASALLFALALAGAQSEPAQTAPNQPATDQPVAATVPAAPAPDSLKPPSHEEMEDMIPEGAPTDDFRFVAWCHGALAGQIELDPLVEKDMDSIEGKAKAAKRKADDEAIAKEHKKYLALYEKALAAAEKASPTAIHQDGVDAELQGYKIWGATRNKAPVWRMVDWGNWEVPPHCQKAAQRLYDRSTLFGAALKSEEPAAPAAPAQAGAPGDAVAAPATEPKPQDAAPGGEAAKGVDAAAPH